jgi:hypothetical protein
MRNVFSCGPLSVIVTSNYQDLYNRIAESLELFDVIWDKPRLTVAIDVRKTEVAANMLTGNYLNCARMNVDASSEGLHATCASGSSGFYSFERDQWSISVLSGIPDLQISSDIDNLVTLVLTTGWRRLGWVPLHSAGVVRENCCAILSAPSGAGKTTLVAALIRRDWRTLGDDKLLLGLNSTGSAELIGLVHTLNLDPKTQEWFPETGDLHVLPIYSVYSEKRRVRIEDFWPGRTVRRGKPTHLVQINLSNELNSIRTTPIKKEEIFSILLHQTVIPGKATEAKQIISTIAATAGQLKGLRVDVGKNVYNYADCLAPLEAALK